ncbi:hypothetical protein LZG04_21050 [Saccharothrix sp. S26]|uniref:hypothetical protein n=1 Tax=Saccharothrix sp. S26 TaxID=2907215 RepID=UPI001F2F94AB|nr:hypothetical protein [Saccharothrix sp. S26]MCE6997271.1 hypothetical protein [Saccharothrix sp. S26]
MDVERSALTSLCRELDALREEARRLPPERKQLLEQVVAEAKARRPVLALLGRLLNTDGDTALRALGAGLPGTGSGHAREELFRCPDGACDLVETPPPAGALPRCRVTGAPMERA